MRFQYNLVLALLQVKGASCWSPTDSYAPGSIECPDVDSLVREASGISASEEAWVQGRHDITDGYLKQFLQHSNLTDFDVDEYIDSLSSSINIGIAFSGGGYRAMFAGAGQLAALDNNTVGAWENGLGGLLESTTYFAALSGGNWLLSTVAYNNWTSVQKILDDGIIWNLENSFIAPYGLELVQDFESWETIGDDINLKKSAGFQTSITDPWGRALSEAFFPGYSDSGAALTISTLRDSEVFSSYQMPLPIHVSDGRTPGSYIINLNSTVFEISPFELGSWDPSLRAFTDTKYLGSSVSNGVPLHEGACIGGFDNAGFILGTSSSLFSALLSDIDWDGLVDLIEEIETLIHDITDEYFDISLYHPNPFANATYGDFDTIAKADTLYLADGGLDDQNIPFAPLIQPDREVDVIFAFDNSADTDDNWPNGSSLVHTYERQFTEQGNGVPFPYVPGEDTFISLNLTHKPTFFGCDASNLTSLSSSGAIPPLVVYVANTDMSYESNKSTYQLAYSEDEKRDMIINGFEGASRMNMTLDADWRSCVSCAILRRSQEKQNITQTAQCKKCFEEYCWDGTVA